MEPKSKKRKLQSGPADNRKPGKRAKKGTKPQANKAKTPRPMAGFRKLDAASLPWKEDPEGIMGLEVIVGVDIVREGDNVEFLVPEAMAGDVAQDQDDEEEEFGGFDDLPEAQGEEGVPLDTDVADGGEEDKEEEEGDDSDEEPTSDADGSSEGGAPVLNDALEADVSAWKP